MKRSVSSVRINEGEVRYRTRIEGEECLPESNLTHLHQLDLLRVLSAQPSLSACGLAPFQRLTIYHNGERWIAEAEAVVEEPYVSPR